VNYSSPAGRPIRVQIWGPIMVDGCPQPGSRVIKRDSGWRGFECCDCPDDRNGGDLDGEPHGTLTWSKPAGATQFEVVVLNPCPVFGISVQLDIKCDDACDDLEIARCMCVDGNDCGPECACCGGVCAKPCECDGIADGIDTFCQPKGNVWSAPCPGGGALFYPPCECENDTQAVYYGEPSGLFSEPSTPLKPGKNLLGCHKRILYASTSYGRYQEPGDCPTGNPNYSCCVKVKFKKKLYVCDGDRLRDVTEDYYVSKADCVGDPIDDCQVNSGPPFGAVIVNLGNCPEGTYCVKMNPRECMPCAECDAVEPDTGFFDTAPTCLPPP
jgi:hypothetical protein